jgi:hypothetical protein
MRTLLVGVIGGTLTLAVFTFVYQRSRGVVWSTAQIIDGASYRTAGQLVGTPDLYKPSAYGELQRKEAGTGAGYRIFLRMPWYAWAVKECGFSAMPYRSAMIAWRTAMAAFAVAFIFVWADWKSAFAAMCCAISFYALIRQGQDSSVMLLAIASAAWLARREMDYAAGAVLALCSIKPNLSVLLPLAILAAGRWKIAMGLIGGVGALLAMSFAVQGSSWPAEFIEVLRNPGAQYAPSPHGKSVVFLLYKASAQTEGIASAILTILCAPLVVRTARRQGVELGLFASVAAAVATSVHSFTHDFLIAMPLALVAAKSESARVRWMAIAVLCPLTMLPSISGRFGIEALSALPVLALMALVALDNRAVKYV